jgi:hypothetical protein
LRISAALHQFDGDHLAERNRDWIALHVERQHARQAGQ